MLYSAFAKIRILRNKTFGIDDKAELSKFCQTFGPRAMPTPTMPAPGGRFGGQGMSAGGTMRAGMGGVSNNPFTAGGPAAGANAIQPHKRYMSGNIADGTAIPGAPGALGGPQPSKKIYGKER